jgi:tetratricopeptide (TPR) repeat protein
MFNQLNPFEEKEDDPNSGSDGGDGDAWGHHAEVPDTASDLRQMANDYYAQSDFDTALPLYTAALEAFEAENEGMHGDDNENQNGDATINENQNKQNDYIDSKVIYLCNRATCLYRMGMYEESRTDAFEAVKISNGESLLLLLFIKSKK